MQRKRVIDGPAAAGTDMDPVEVGGTAPDVLVVQPRRTTAAEPRAQAKPPKYRNDRVRRLKP